jgi:hypothetical protein
MKVLDEAYVDSYKAVKNGDTFKWQIMEFLYADG